MEAEADAAAEAEAERREEGIQEMEEWFHLNFEDPQNQTPYDQEDGKYQYIWGGPFDAADMIGNEFGHQYNESWIEAAVEHVEKDGTYEWAPNPSGDFYDGFHAEEKPEIPDESQREISLRILSRLDELEVRLAELAPSPPNIGHNFPPDEIGLPPYNEESKRDLENALQTTREEVHKDTPDPERLVQVESHFRSIGTAVAGWIGKKLDLAVDESIKATVKAVAWGAVATLALGIADDIARFIRLLIGS